MPVKFYILPRKTKQGESPIRISVSIKYAGRRTFICFALSSGVPPQVVMKLIEDAWDR